MRDDERVSEMVWSYHMRGMTTSQVSIAMEMAGEHVDPGRVHDIVVARSVGRGCRRELQVRRGVSVMEWRRAKTGRPRG